jgi:hypothetical protein
MEISTLLTVLLVLGAVIILISLASFFVPALKLLSSGRQRFKGFGIELEVNTIALTLLLGIFLTLPGFYLYIKNYESTTAKLSAQVLDAQRTIDRLQQEKEEGRLFNVEATLQFRGVQAVREEFLNRIQIYYSTPEGTDVLIKKENIKPGISANGDCINVTLKDFPRGAYLTKLRVVNTADGSQWVFDKVVQPLKPIFEMERLP